VRKRARIVVVVAAVCGGLALFVCAPSRQPSAKLFCDALAPGTAAASARAQARAQGYSVITLASVPGFVVGGKRNRLQSDFCEVHISAGTTEAARYHPP
jgi:hypothetical protein